MKFYFVEYVFFVYAYFRFSENIINSSFYKYFVTCIKYVCIFYIAKNWCLFIFIYIWFVINIVFKWIFNVREFCFVYIVLGFYNECSV